VEEEAPDEYEADEEVEETGVDEHGRMKGPTWDHPRWTECRQAWERRGLKYPPTREQRTALWYAVVLFPTKIADWIDGAPRQGGTNAIAKYVLAKASDEAAAISRRAARGEPLV
jgi:hypothetical protein